MTTNTFMNVNSDISSEGGCGMPSGVIANPPHPTRLKVRQVFNFIVMFVHRGLKLCNLRLKSGFRKRQQFLGRVRQAKCNKS